MRRTRTSLGGPLDAVDRGAKPPADLPLGISPVVWELSVPASVAPVPERVALGSALFSDERLSLNDTVSSATCHEQFGRVALLHDMINWCIENPGSSSWRSSSGSTSRSSC